VNNPLNPLTAYSSACLNRVEGILRDGLRHGAEDVIDIELENFANELRAEVQHREIESGEIYVSTENGGEDLR
jgi:hypothetical protein